MPAPRVLFIVGYGRSGSTVLDTVLGSHEEIVSVGELTNLVRAGFQNDELCSCGVAGSQCLFWSEVRATWHRLVPGLDEDEYQRHVHRFDRPYGWWTGAWRLRRRALRRYVEELRGLYAAVHEVSGATWILDSSKLAGRATVLLQSGVTDLRLLHLIRDGRGVAWSLRKSFAPDLAGGVQQAIAPLPAWRTAVLWSAVNRYSASLVRRGGSERGISIRYEDFTANAHNSLQAIAGLTDLDLGALAQQVSDGAEFPVRHAIAGNRLRMRGTVRVRSDQEWRDKLPASARRTMERLAHGTLKRFGYLET